MNINSKRFGTVEVSEDRIISFQDGLLGFPNLKRFFLVDDPEDPMSPFKWLIAVDDPEFGFLVTDPGIFFQDYVFDLSEQDRSQLKIKSEDDVTVITMLTVPNDPKQITANLRGPLVINWHTLEGRQAILKDRRYTTKHFIFIQEEEKQAVVATKEDSASAEQPSFLTPSAIQKDHHTTKVEQ